MESTKQAIRELFLELDFANQVRESIVKPAVNEALNSKIEEINMKMEVMEEKYSAVVQKLGAAESKIQQLEAYSRRNNLTISGVPETDGEETDQLVLDVAKSAGVMLTPDDIDVSHRVGRPKNNKTRNLVVKFLSHNVREKLFTARKDKSANRVRSHPLLTAEAIRGIYISENLTPESQKLLFVCRQLKAKNKVWGAYSTNGRVKVRLGQDQTPKIIECVEDLEQLVGETCVREILDEPPRATSGPDGDTDVTTPTARSEVQHGGGIVPPAGSRVTKVPPPPRGHQAPRRHTARGPRESR